MPHFEIHVNNVDDARRFVAACSYAPDGMRSFGPTRAILYAGADYAKNANATWEATIATHARRYLGVFGQGFSPALIARTTIWYAASGELPLSMTTSKPPTDFPSAFIASRSL